MSLDNKCAVVIVESLENEIENSDSKTQKLFYKQKRFMEIDPNYPSLGKTKLQNVKNQYGDDLWEVRLDGKRRIAMVEKNDGSLYVWLKVVSHDEIRRKNVIYTESC